MDQIRESLLILLQHGCVNAYLHEVVLKSHRTGLTMGWCNAPARLLVTAGMVSFLCWWLCLHAVPPGARSFPIAMNRTG